jgi:hypothetical protein
MWYNMLPIILVTSSFGTFEYMLLISKEHSLVWGLISIHVSSSINFIEL